MKMERDAAKKRYRNRAEIDFEMVTILREQRERLDDLFERMRADPSARRSAEVSERRRMEFKAAHGWAGSKRRKHGQE